MRGLPDDFIANLQTAIATVNEAQSRQAAFLSAQAAATAAALTLLFKQLRGIMRELDAIVRNVFRNDPATLAASKSASHIERAAKRRKETPPPVE